MSIGITQQRIERSWVQPMNSPLRKSLPMGLGSAAIGAIATVLVVATATGEGYGWLLLAGPLAGFISGGFLWWMLVARRGRTGIGYPLLAGGLSGAVSHYVCWYLVILAAAVCHAATGGCTDSLGEPPMNPVQALGGAAVYSAISLLFIGWFTIPAGAFMGFLLAWIQRKSHMPPE